MHPANTYRLANALIKANKRFDLFILPGKRHGYGRWATTSSGSAPTTSSSTCSAAGRIRWTCWSSRARHRRRGRRGRGPRQGRGRDSGRKLSAAYCRREEPPCDRTSSPSTTSTSTAGSARREFLDRLTQTFGGTAAAFALLPTLENNYLQAPIVAADDKSLEVGRASYDAAGTKMSGYLAREKGGKKRPAVIVVHENRGLNPHIEDIVRRLALEDFIAFAPDALFPLGGYPGDEDAARTLFAKLDQAKTQEDFLAAADHLSHVEGGDGQHGCGRLLLGRRHREFPCDEAAAPWRRGTVLWRGAAGRRGREDQGRAAGRARSERRAGQRRMAGLRERVEGAGVRYDLYQPAGTQHGFNNDTTPRYDKDAATLAWGRTVAFLRNI